MYRFAPSPTGDMHIGDLRIALFNYISAQQSNEKFIIRIEDTDKEKNIEGKDQEIVEILHLFGIISDQILYQSENLKFHRQLASKLLMDGHAFSCFCTPETFEKEVEYHYDGTCKKLSDEEVMANENPFVVRIKKPDVEIEFTDIIKGKISFKANDIDDFVILKVDKTPTHNFASAIDDMLQSIKMIIKEEDQMLDTAREELIRKYLGYNDKVEYAHLPSIKNSTFSIKALLEDGFLPNAITNYLILTGNKTPTEIFTLDEAKEWFDIKKISKERAIFDMEELKEINKEHIKKLNPLELSKYIGYSSKDIGELAKVYLEEASTINEIKAKIDTIFSTKTCEDFTEEFETLKSASKDMPFFKEFDEFKTYLADKSGLNDKKLLKPLRVLLTGKKSGPNLDEIYPHIKNYLGEIIK